MIWKKIFEFEKKIMTQQKVTYKIRCQESFELKKKKKVLKFDTAENFLMSKEKYKKFDMRENFW